MARLPVEVLRRSEASAAGLGPADIRTLVATRQRRVRLPAVVVYAASVALAIAVWQWLAMRSATPLLFPTPGTTFHRVWALLANGTLLHASAVSLMRILVGFAAGSVAGILLGLAMGRSAVMRAIAEPYVHFFRFIPPLAWFAPVLLWFGSGETAKIVLIVYTTIFVVALNTMAGVAAVPKNKTRMAQAFGASGRQSFFLVTLPASAPYIFAGMRIAMGNSFMTVVAAEMLAATQGLGFLVNSGLLFLEITTVFAAIIALGVLGFATDRFFLLLIRRFGGRFTIEASEAR